MFQISTWTPACDGNCRADICHIEVRATGRMYYVVFDAVVVVAAAAAVQ